LRTDELLQRPEILSAAHWQVVGTVDDAVAQITEWSAAGAIDGFLAAPGGSVESLHCVLERLIPRLAEAGLFRSRYTGTTFMEHLQESR
jgi:alkanesulfonate monooxygenase SsuD/methylene tetrahydromethanopterin reductase-like flavin-dependent oxidoreductase (luciferase family)